MPRITVDLLRKRAEHNDGALSDLKEIALHQQDLEAIEVIGDACRQLEILYLQSNLISKIENLHHLKYLQYLNLAVNNITVIENLEGCESLTKLDLTLNFVSDLTSIQNLCANAELRSLFLVGNGCTKLEGYRYFVADTLPQLLSLDGEEITKSERIRAKQEAIPVREEVDRQRAITAAEEEEKRRRKELGIEEERKVNEKGEKLYGHSPEERLAAYQEMQETIKRNTEHPPSEFDKIKEAAKPVTLTPEEELAKYGRVLQKNQAQLPYKLWEEPGFVKLNVEVPRHIATQLCDVDVQPTYVRVVIKGKVLQLVLPQEVAPDNCNVQRATVNGHLLITMPVAAHQIEAKKRAPTEPRPGAGVRTRHGEAADLEQALD
eukprot:TRINITY_DN15980_c0_g1_i1.p1 TRINITY_DN15980_c0_g1~~TRINITY_DN15980_c0_g1_i1.p1  ORF type:complete len:377 (-),score=104.10 TRINITY_DN15980_c0_g1_i1:77-1207(-)